MKNIIDYAEGYLDSFAERPFCTADSVVLSWLAYLRLPAQWAETRSWQGMPLRDLFCAEHFAQLFSAVWDAESTRRLFTAVAASPRYRPLRVMGFAEDTDIGQEKQFAAVTFSAPGDFSYVAFRGTNATFVGWKEDFNMAFQYPIPSQQEAARYLEAAARCTEGALYVGGHSKGGNMAVHAAACAQENTRARLRQVYSHDGPGFMEEVLESGQFVSIAPLVDKTLPQSSIVGLLMESQETARIVKSSSVSIWQHNPFSWEMEGPAFITVESLAGGARYVDKTLHEWLAGLSAQDRERFVETVYSLFESEKDTSFAEALSRWQTALPEIASAAGQMDPESKRFLSRTLKGLTALAMKNLSGLFRPAKAEEGGAEA